MIEEPPKLQIHANFRRPSKAQIDAFRGIPTGFLCDAMEGQGALCSSIQHIGHGRDLPNHAFGPALVADNGPAEILATMGAVHIAQAGDIIVAAVHGHRNCSAAGDQFCGMMKNKGLAAFVTDGEMRDYDGIVAAGLPAWCAGLSPNSPYSNGPGKVGFGAVVGGRYIESGDMIVADRDGVVVVPFARIDAVIAQLDAIKALEVTLEARVKSGFCEMPAIEAMLENGSAVMVE
jgi:regulator of RNase E activity RraA